MLSISYPYWVVTSSPLSSFFSSWSYVSTLQRRCLFIWIVYTFFMLQFFSFLIKMRKMMPSCTLVLRMDCGFWETQNPTTRKRIAGTQIFVLASLFTLWGRVGQKSALFVVVILVFFFLVWIPEWFTGVIKVISEKWHSVNNTLWYIN